MAYYASLGVAVTRVMTDNGSCYRVFAFRDACEALNLRHDCSGRSARLNRSRTDSSGKPSSLAPDECQPIDVAFIVKPLVSCRPRGARQQTDLLVIADRLEFAAGGLGDATDCESRAHPAFPLNLQLL